MKKKNFAKEIKEAVNELDLEIVDEWNEPCRFDKSIQIYYISFKYASEVFTLSASSNGYCLSNNKKPFDVKMTNSINAMKTLIILEIGRVKENVC